jgi:hypothetical protein
MTENKEIKFLYHGTTAKTARKALIEGIKTRSDTGHKGNWAHSIDSPEDRVYLTNAYAGYFADAATKDPKEHWGIIEVDVSKIREGLLPDEDFLEQATRNQPLPEPEDCEDDLYNGLRYANEIKDSQERMVARTEWYKDNIFGYQQYWRDSVKHLGNCCHFGNIPPEAITRITIFDPKSNRDIYYAVDPTITLMNYVVAGRKYREITKWLAGYDADPEAVCGLFFPGAKVPVKTLSQEELDRLPESVRQATDDMRKMRDQMVDAVEHWKANILSNRSGLEVILND